jgi:hypothetical protein
MTSWKDFSDDAPELAQLVRGRFEATGLAFVATLRGDGSPRISGVEPLFAMDELWLGMMERSRKGQDLRRDPRLALHAASVDKEMKGGDVKLSGRAVDVGADPALRGRYLEQFAEANGYAPTDQPFDLFRVDLSDAVLLRVADDRLVIEWWRPGRGVQRVERT